MSFAREEAVFELAPIPIVRLGGAEARLNGAARALLGGAPEDARAIGDQLGAREPAGERLRRVLVRRDGSRVSFDVCWTRAGDVVWCFLSHPREEAFKRGGALDAHETLARVLEQVPLAIVAVTAREGVVFCNAYASSMLGVMATEPRQAFPVVSARAREPLRRESLPLTRALAGEHVHRDDLLVLGPGGELPIEVWAAPVRDRTGEVVFGVAAHADISSRRAAEAALAESRAELLVLHRKAGMAEVASGVLHNIGNVLNSVNVSFGLAQEKIAASRAAKLGQVISLLEPHAGDLSAFLENDPRGAKVKAYLGALSTELAAERQELLELTMRAATSLEHIRAIVAKQRELALAPGARETCEPKQLIEDALWMTRTSFERHHVELVVSVPEDLPAVELDRHRVLQVLVNLIINAKQSVTSMLPKDPKVTVSLAFADGELVFEVSDNGRGVASEHHELVFSRGFTTKPDGHGLGLHNSAVAAGELGGTLAFSSEGVGRGAVFSLRLPVKDAGAS